MFVGLGLRPARLRRSGLRRAFYVPILVRPPVRARHNFGQGKKHVVQQEKNPPAALLKRWWGIRHKNIDIVY
jgi:hypothetical protein